MLTSEIEWTPETLRSLVASDAGATFVLEKLTQHGYLSEPTEVNTDTGVETYADGSRLVWRRGAVAEILEP